MKPSRHEKKFRRGAYLARRAWVRFQGKHDPGDEYSMDECVLCDGEGCRACGYVGMYVGGWIDEDGQIMRGMHGPNRKIVQDTNGSPAEGRFKGWNGKRKSLRPSTLESL